MKKISKLLFILTLFGVGIFQGKSQVVDLPIFVDFTEFKGTNLSEIAEGWVEGSGFPTPSFLNGGWFRGDAIYNNNVTIATNLDDANHHQWIASPEFKVTKHTALFFKASITLAHNRFQEASLADDDELAVYVSEDGGTSFKKLKQFSKDLEYDLKEFYVDLSAYANRTIKIAFHASDGDVKNSVSCVHLDDIKIKNMTKNDLGLNRFDIEENVEQSKDFDFYLNITNEGLCDQANLPIKLDIRGPENKTEIFILKEEIKSTKSKNVLLTKLNLKTSGKYTIKATSILTTDKDKESAFSQEVLVRETKKMPLEMLDFTNTYDDISRYDGWKEAMGTPGRIRYGKSRWKAKEYKGKFGYNCWFVGLFTNEWMISPSFIPEKETKLFFDAALKLVEGATGMGSDDKMIIYVTEDGGLTWNELSVMDNDDVNSSWKQFTFNLGKYAGKTIKIAFFGTTGKKKDNMEYHFFIDNLKIQNISSKDIELVQLLKPSKSAEFSNSEKVSVLVKNIGLKNIENFSLAYTLNNGKEVKENVKHILKPNDQFVYEFKQSIDLAGDKDAISIKAYLDGDGSMKNNEIKNIALENYNYNISTQGKYKQSFEDNEDFSAWVIINGNNDQAVWKKFHHGGQYDFEGYYTFSYSSRKTTTQSNDWLISNAFYFEKGKEYSLSFYFANQAGFFPEKLKVTIGKAQTIEAQSKLILDLGELKNNVFQKAKKSFTVEENGYYYIGWHAYGEKSQFAMFIDNISIREKADIDLAVTNAFIPYKADKVKNTLKAINSAYVEIENQGELEVNNIPITMKLTNEDGTKSLTKEFTKAIAPGEKVKLKLEDENFGFDFTKPLTAEFSVNNKKDLNSRNNTFKKEKYQHINYTTSFEFPAETEDWIVANTDGGKHQWERQKDLVKSKTGEHFYSIRTNPYQEKKNTDWLITQGLYLEKGACYKLNFWFRNAFSTETIKVYLEKSEDYETYSNKIFEESIEDRQGSVYKEAEVFINVEKSGIYYLGFLSDREVDNRNYLILDDISLVKTEIPELKFDLEIEQLGRQAIVSIENANQNVKEWTWSIENKTFDNVNNFEYTFQKEGTYNIKLKAGNQCAYEEKQKSITLDFPDIANDFKYSVDKGKVSFAVDNKNTIGVLWNFDDGNTSPELKPVHKYAKSGTYNVSVALYNNWGIFNISKEISVKVVGIFDREKLKLSIYPNPADDNVNVVIDNDGLLEILTINGSVVKQQLVKSGKNTINISDLKTGMYTVRCCGKFAKLIIK